MLVRAISHLADTICRTSSSYFRWFSLSPCRSQVILAVLAFGFGYGGFCWGGLKMMLSYRRPPPPECFVGLRLLLLQLILEQVNDTSNK